MNKNLYGQYKAEENFIICCRIQTTGTRYVLMPNRGETGFQRHLHFPR